MTAKSQARFWQDHYRELGEIIRGRPTRGGRRPWTAGEEEQLLELLARGGTAREVAAAIGRTKSAVETRRRILRLRDPASISL